MLPLPELDDQNFQMIVEDARKMIPQLFAGWTDENYHDPGITLIELLAWLTEMQQFYLNQITYKNKLMFLKLLGTKLKNAIPARTDVTFSNVEKMLILPAASKLAAGDQLFETVEPLFLVPAQIEKILVCSGEDYRDFTSFNETRGLSYYAFGQEAKKGNKLMIGLSEKLPCKIELSLFLHLFEDYTVKPGPLNNDNEMIPPARVLWKYYGKKDNGDSGWIPLEIVRDESIHFTCSGAIKFIIPYPMEATRFSPVLDRDRFWIACFLQDDVYELPHRLEDICLNTVSVLQQSTLSEIHEFSSTGTKEMQFKVSSSVAIYGLNQVQVRDQNGDWIFWKEIKDISQGKAGEPVFCLKLSEHREMIIKFGNGEQGMIPPSGENNIRVISYLPEFQEQRWLGQSNGLPEQSFKLPVSPLLGAGLKLQIGKKSNVTGEVVWQDWQLVEDFAASGSADRHYVLDEEQGVIRFGNHENAIIPEKGDEPNILLISYKTGGGIRGNVKEYEINRLLEVDPEFNYLHVVNHRPAYNGSNKETITDAFRRLLTERHRPFRAVTSSDFEALALLTPGLRVARVKAVPLYKPGLRNYPHKTAPAQVTIAVVPYSESLTPVPSAGFKETVRRYLNRHRLLTTEIHVVAPEYIKISIYATVVVVSGAIRGNEKIIQAIDYFLQPVDRDDLSRGWPFGRTVYRGDIYEVINRIPGVEYVKDLWISAEGNGIRQERSGDIQIPPCGLVYPGTHEIDIINHKDL
ncbi:MAG: putative baseplate assembly protein [Syntrophomonadaceae bacterium]|jgi:hypothetical protein